MEIRRAAQKDSFILQKHDHHISGDELEVLIKLNRVYLMEEDGEFIGWMRYNLFWDNTPFMNMLYLLPESREKSYGRLMVSHWENEMKDLGYKTVMTSTVSEEFAQHFYIKLGYQTVGGFLPPGEPFELILIKQL